MNIAPERLDNLIRLGYTPEEARFLYIVATHSGYFRHRQFLDFSGTKPGKHSQKFLAKLLTQKHATYRTHQSGGRVYHIFSRKIFNGIGRDDLRTRRKHELDYVKTRMVTLDFILSNLHCDYLETEAEKVPFFESRLKLSRSLMPARIYSSKVSANHTVRYFVDRFPLFVKDRSVASPVVVFTYIDAASATLQGFLTHLEAYGGLLRSVPQFEFIYVAPTDRFFQAAESEFARIVLGQAKIPSNDDLIRYFQLRKRWEAGERVAAADVVLLNRAKRERTDKSIESQYSLWVAGKIKDADICCSVPQPELRINGRFSTRKCGDSLSVFYRSGDGRSESDAEIASGAFSRTFSPEVSPQ
jgi:hypothetical protein